ncbi:UDP-2-acetamido-2-deoxy-ribo-hexuluronate aminotransferase [Lachnospiraceae bacterium PF1-22]|uniref:DegT/DnrJ/EryC1/StrS family aminotransferase n=1 Tax=Ohessyouella blattaphilus TaxID=2949333 RepID=UPI003E259C09
MQFRDLQEQYNNLKTEMDKAVLEVMQTGTFIGGKPVIDLETQLADYVGVDHCITCANGTDALSLVMMAWGISKGDAVFVPDFTFFASGEIVSLCGATPVFYDVEMDTFNADGDSLERAIQEVLLEGALIPKAIMAVDLFGLPANYRRLEQIAQKHNLLLLEDGAQGFGGSIDGIRACSFGDVATTSFFPAKPLGCYGDGGAIFTNDQGLAEYIRSICVHGKGTYKYDNIRIGVNSRLDTIQAAILQVKLKAFAEYELNNVNDIAKVYTMGLERMVETPIIAEGFGSSWAQYTIKLKDKIQRNDLQQYLNEHGIPSMIYYPKPMHAQTAYKSLQAYVNCENTNMLCDVVLSLPMHPYLKKEEVSQIIEFVQGFLDK